jgi:hypothetical protein
VSKWAALMAGFLLASAGCGYHVGGRAELMPKNAKTIAVPAFKNITTRYELARQLPAEITRELLARTRYQVISDPSQADLVLWGTLANFTAYPTVSDPQSGGRATAAQVVVTVNLMLLERATGKKLLERNGAEFRERYEISLDPKAYFDESGAANARVSRDVARTIVSNILEDF